MNQEWMKILRAHMGEFVKGRGFKRSGAGRVSIEDQLTELSACSVRLPPGVSIEDLFLFNGREEMESKPYGPLIEALAYSDETDFAAFCDRLWMCDYECIEDHGAYDQVLNRLQLLSDQRLPIASVRDYVDIEEDKAWIEFTLYGSNLHWDLEVQDDWMDPSIVVRFDELLKAHTDLRIYSNHTDYGQSALFACFTAPEFARFDSLSMVRLRSIAEQAMSS